MHLQLFPMWAVVGPPRRASKNLILESLKVSNWTELLVLREMGGILLGWTFKPKRSIWQQKNDWYFTNFFSAHLDMTSQCKNLNMGVVGDKMRLFSYSLKLVATFEPNGTRLTIDNWASLSSERLSKVQHNMSSIQSSLGLLPMEISSLSAAICTWWKPPVGG